MKKASTEDLRIFLMEVTDEIGSAHPETRDTKISARLLRDILTELLANREAQPVAEYGDAYQGAREDLSIWKRRALEAEGKVRHLERVNDHLVKEAQGEHRMGEPVFTAPPAPVVNPEFTGATAVPTFEEWLSTQENKPLGWVRDSMKESYDACRAAMLAQPVSQGCIWIACGEQLPAVGETVLVSSDGYVSVGELERSGANYRYFTSVATGRELTVTHWMPLPAAPEGGNDA